MGCTGDCCSKFYLTKQTQLGILNGKTNDDELIRMMLVPLGDNHFTCKFWIKETKKCAIYQHRPQMCRDYPTKGNPCGLKGCSLK